MNSNLINFDNVIDNENQNNKQNLEEDYNDNPFYETENSVNYDDIIIENDPSDIVLENYDSSPKLDKENAISNILEILKEVAIDCPIEHSIDNKYTAYGMKVEDPSTILTPLGVRGDFGINEKTPANTSTPVYFDKNNDSMINELVYKFSNLTIDDKSDHFKKTTTLFDSLNNDKDKDKDKDKYFSYFSHPDPFSYFSHSNAYGIHTYSFALNPGEYQPSGSINISYADIPLGPIESIEPIEPDEYQKITGTLNMSQVDNTTPETTYHNPIYQGIDIESYINPLYKGNDKE